MAKKFQFRYLDKSYYASAQVFHENGRLKYRVAFDSNLIVLHELTSSIGSPTGLVYVQEVDRDETALPDELIQEIGLGLENIDFFPGAFVVDHNDYYAVFIKDANNYKMVDCYLPNIESIQLPVIFTKEVKENVVSWRYNTAGPKPEWFDKIVTAIDEYEKEKELR